MPDLSGSCPDGNYSAQRGARGILTLRVRVGGRVGAARGARSARAQRARGGGRTTRSHCCPRAARARCEDGRSCTCASKTAMRRLAACGMLPLAWSVAGVGRGALADEERSRIERRPLGEQPRCPAAPCSAIRCKLRVARPSRAHGALPRRRPSGARRLLPPPSQPLAPPRSSLSLPDVCAKLSEPGPERSCSR